MSDYELYALSPLDGRYARAVDALREYLSEYALFRDRVGVEIAYLRALSQRTPLVRPLTPAEDQFLLSILESFSSAAAQRIQMLERETRHDVKAVEYFLRERLVKTTLHDLVPWLHFGLTSEDVNQTAMAFELLEARDAVILPALDKVVARLKELARTYAATPMLARTHGQPAVPTTLGKEFANFYVRLRAQRTRLREHQFTAKLTGAVGNFNALAAAAPTVDWLEFHAQFLDSLGLAPSLHNTQLMPYDNWIEYFDALRLTNSILLDLVQDLWRYISDDWLKQKTRAGEVGSSTMPQKVNPIDFENAEGNLGIANALLEFYARKLPISRLQRDLSDSTTRRTFGVALGHTLVAWESILRGLDKIEPDAEKMRAVLDAHWESITEGAQTILRAAGVPDAYEQLKSLTRGKVMNRNAYLIWVDSLALPDSIREQLRALSPTNYIGLAEQLTRQALEE
jgi:adenylosuccinate lyase